MKTFEELQSNILEWARVRGILERSTPEKQLLKTMEELGETARAVLKKDFLGQIDGLGDTVVTLILAADLLGLDLNQCLESAWNEIADRQGEMVNGVFVKKQLDTASN